MSDAQFSVHEQEAIRRITSDWKLTPATLGYKLSRGDWIPSPHLMYISKVVASAIARGNGRIIISAHPRSGKSQLIDIYTPVWILEQFPKKHVILASYGADLSEGFGRQARDIILENPDKLRVRIKSDASRVDNFGTETGGGMMSRGLGGSITGRGADVLLIDDYIKEIKEALSPVYREYVWNWFTTTAYTRLEPGGTLIIIATRWHSDDLIGRVLNQFPGMWTNIVLPAEALENDILGRKPGEALFPQRYPIEKLHEIKTVLGSSFYEALYQQTPIDELKKISDGAWLKRCEICPNMQELKLIRMWDLAATEGGGDFTTGALCGWDRARDLFYIINVKRKQLSPQQAEELVRKTAVEDGDVEVGIEQEPGSSGKALCDHFDKTVLKEFKVTPFPAANMHKKLIRAQPLLAGAESGKVILVAGAWNDGYVREFDTFPVGPYDDQVDVTAAAYTHLTGKKVFTATWGRSTPQNKSGMKGIQGAMFQMSNRRSVSWGRSNNAK